MNPALLTSAQNQLAPVYGQAQQGLQAQLPAIGNLYSALVQGLGTQANTQVQNVVNSAAARGVARPTLGSDVQAQLGQELAKQTGTLGAQQGQQTAAAQMGIGQLGVQQVQDANTLANSLQNLQQTQQKAASDRLANDRQFQMDTQKAQQGYNINVQQAATSNAKAAASQAPFDITSVSQTALTRQLRLGLGATQGKDGKVSPENLAKAYNTWMSAGLTPDSFWKAFQGKWNPKQQSYGDQFHYFVQKGV